MKTPIPAIFDRHKALSFFRNRPNLTRRFAAVLMTLGAVLAASTNAWADGRYYNSNATIYTSHPDWMGWLPESLKLSELSIPGTHDSGAYESYAGFTSSAVYTQGLTIASQLQAGIRFFDIRCRHIDNVFVLHHGDIVLDPGGVQLNYGAVLGTMNTFLDNHPSETIVMRIGGSGVPSASGTTRTYGETFNWYRDGTTGGRRIWQKPGINRLDGITPTTKTDRDQGTSFEKQDYIPTLGEVRGKIVILQDFRSDGNSGSDGNSTKIHGIWYRGGTRIDIHDDYDIDYAWQLSDHWDRAQTHLIAADTNSSVPPGLVLTWLNLSGGILPSTGAGRDPSIVFGMNDHALEHVLRTRITNRTGIVAMDYPGEALIDIIIAQNFRKSAESNNAIVVTNNNDSGEGSLRWAIDRAKNPPVPFAADFEYAFNNIAYNGTDIGGSRQALDRATQLITFLNNVLPGEGMSTLVWQDGDLTVAYKTDDQGLFKETDWIDTDNIFETREYKAIAFNSRSGSTSYTDSELKSVVDASIGSLSGNEQSRADQLHAAVSTALPENQWTVLVKTGDGGFDNWAFYYRGNFYKEDHSGITYVVWGTALPTSRRVSTITFAPALAGQTITLTSGRIDIRRSNITIDASALPGGITISGNDSSRVFLIGGDSRVVLKRTHIVHGLAPGYDYSGKGGGILNAGILSIYDSTISMNTAGNDQQAGGGGIANFGGVLEMENCTIASNSCRYNTSRGGSALLNEFQSRMYLKHCTVANNTASFADDAGAIKSDGDGARLELENTIVAGNLTLNGVPQDVVGRYWAYGRNIIQATSYTRKASAGLPPITLDPLLAPLADNGGGMMTMRPRAGSPAIDAAYGSLLPSDQRGVLRPIGPAADLGAVEARVGGTTPGAGATNVALQGVTLTWGGLPGATFEIFFDGGSGFVSLGQTTGSSIAAPGALAFNTEYVWRVDTIVRGVTYTGDPQSFTTRSPVVVTTLADENDPGLGVGTGESLREALAFATNGELITFAPGLSGGSIALGGNQLEVANGVTIDGSALQDKIKINAGGASRVFRVSGANPVHLKGLTISGGSAAQGGGVHNDGAMLTLEECRLTGNASSGQGGAVFNTNGGSLSIDESTVSGNTADEGGGIYSTGGGALAVSFSTFSQNSARTGGGIYNNSGPLNGDRCTFSGNTASSAGGGVFNAGGSGVVVNSTLHGNTSIAGTGGGISNHGGASVVFRHCTIAENFGAGIFNNAPAGLALDNTIVANNYSVGNSPFDIQGDFTAVGANLVRVHGGSVLSGPAPLASDPVLGSFASYGGGTRTMPPLVGSPVIDAGVVTANTPSTDQKNAFRPNGPFPDIGSIESRLSADTNLDWLTTSAGALDPSFQSSLTDYTAMVAHSVKTAAVRPALGQSGQTMEVRINGGAFAAIQDKEASAEMPLNPGENPIEVKVLAQNGTTTKTYTITVIRGAPSVADASFASLSTSAGSLTPAFAPGVLFYNLAVANATTSTTITAGASNPGATIEIRSGGAAFSPLASGVVSAPLTLEVGTNSFDLRVTAADGITVESHTLIVTRDASPFSNANLAALSTSAGPLNQVFNRGIPFYNVTVSDAVTSTTVTATKAEASATIRARVNGGAFSVLASGTPSSSMNLQGGANYIEVKVTAPDGATVNSYTIIVTRVIDSMEWVSELGNNDSPPNFPSKGAVISADCRFVAFSSRATNLVPGDTNSREDVFVYDRVNDTTERVSVDKDGQQGDRDSRNPSISADGRYVAYQSEARNLVPDDSNDQSDIFVYDRLATQPGSRIERVSVRSNGSQANQASETPSISGDGRFVAFASSDSNMVPDFDEHSNVNVYIHDRSDDTLTGIVVSFAEFNLDNRDSLNPVISSDGNFVAFEFSVQKSVGSTEGYEYTDIYLHERGTVGASRITGTRFGLAANETFSRSPAISADGRYVAFHSNLQNLDFYDTNSTSNIRGGNDVFVYDSAEETTRRVSADRDGFNDGNGEFGEDVDSFNPSISGDGRYVAFESNAPDLVTPDTNGYTHVFLKDLVTAGVSLVSVSSGGVESNGGSFRPSLSFDGRCVAFQSTATNLGASDTNFSSDVFVAVTEALAPSALADLSSLTIESNVLIPGFSSGVTSYGVNLSNDVETVRVRPVAADAKATIQMRINSGAFSPVDSNAIAALPLDVGLNTVAVRVTAGDGSTIRTYTVGVTRAASDVAELSDLALDGGDLTSEFLSGVTAYQAEVGNEVASVTIYPTAADANASVTVNGQSLASGAASSPIRLNVGGNNITMVVTAEDSASTMTYVVTVVRAPSSNADLAGLVSNVGLLSPEFSGTTTTYAINVANPINTMTVTPFVAESGATVTVNGAAVLSGTASAELNLEVGINAITTKVTAPDGSTTQIYTISVIRFPRADAELAGLTTSSGQLSPVFASDTTAYTVNVGNDINALAVTPTAVDGDTFIAVNGVQVTSGTASNPIILEVGSNVITTLVIAQDAVTTWTYTLTVTRAASAGAEIVVEQPLGTNVADAGSRDFGAIAVGSSTSLTFTIKNTGNANLTGLTLTTDGANAADFTVTSSPVAPVAGPSGSTTFTVRFAPGAAGVRTAALHIANNDADENPFDITISGTGVAIDPYDIAFVGTPYDLRVGNQVTFDLKRLLADGETVKVGGKLPSGLKFNATTGLLTGIISGKAGTYQTVIQVLQGKTVVRTIAFPITVLEFPPSLIGNFDFLKEDSESIPSGVCKFTITSGNRWSATLESAGATKRRSAKGSFILDEGSPIAPIIAVFPAIKATSSVAGVPALTVNIPIDGSTPTITGTYNGGTLRGFRIAKVGQMPLATVAYNLVLDAGEQDDIDIPAGLGWMKGKVSNKGIGTFKGLLGDGTTASLTLRLSPSGQAILWSQPYKNKNSYIGGIVTLPNLDQPANANEKLADNLWWSKAPDLKTLSYPDGFPGMSVTLGTSRWTTPSSAIAMGSSLGWRDNSKAKVTIDGGGLSNQKTQSTAASLPTEFSLDDKFNLVTSAPTSTPLVAWKGKVSKTDGAITGTLTIPAGFSNDFPSGSAAVSGVLVQGEPWDTTTGCGQIKVPATGPKGSFRTATIVLDQ